MQALAQYGDKVLVFPDGDSVFVHDSDEPWRREGFDLGLDSVRFAEANDDLIYTVSDRAFFLDLLSMSGKKPSINVPFEFPDDYPRIPYSFNYDNISISENDRLAVMLSTSSGSSTRCGIFNIEDPLSISLITYLDYFGSTIALSEDGNTLMSFPFYYSYGKGYAYNLTSIPDSVSIDTLTILPEEFRQVENRTVFGDAISHENYWYITCTPSQGLNSGGYLCILSQSTSNEFITENLIEIGPHIPTNLTIKEDILIGSNDSIYMWDIKDPVNPELLVTVPALGNASHAILTDSGFLHVADGHSYIAYDVRQFLPARLSSVTGNPTIVKIWPNPSNGTVSFTVPNLQAEIINVSIYNILGQLVDRSTLNYNRVNTLYFPARIQSGHYYMEIEAPGQNVHGKLTIIR